MKNVSSDSNIHTKVPGAPSHLAAAETRLLAQALSSCVHHHKPEDASVCTGTGTLSDQEGICSCKSFILQQDEPTRQYLVAMVLYGRDVHLNANGRWISSVSFSDAMDLALRLPPLDYLRRQYAPQAILRALVALQSGCSSPEPPMPDQQRVPPTEWDIDS